MFKLLAALILALGVGPAFADEGGGRRHHKPSAQGDHGKKKGKHAKKHGKAKHHGKRHRN